MSKLGGEPPLSATSGSVGEARVLERPSSSIASTNASIADDAPGDVTGEVGFSFGAMLCAGIASFCLRVGSSVRAESAFLSTLATCTSLRAGARCGFDGVNVGLSFLETTCCLRGGGDGSARAAGGCASRAAAAGAAAGACAAFWTFSFSSPSSSCT